jgi:Tfp pilus assembly protein PilN
MIEINLLPEESLVKTRAQRQAGPGFKFDKRYVIYALPAVVAILIAAHLIFAAALIIKNAQLNNLEKKWKKLESQRSALGNFQGARSMLAQDASVIQQLSKARVNWASKLSTMSLNLPSGVWFTDFTVNQKDFLLQGSVISLQKDEIGLLDKFMDALRADPVFYADFNSLEVGQVLKKQLGGYEIADFTIKGTLKQK